MIKGSIPEFFPKVDRADAPSKSKKEADASGLLSSNSASSSGTKSAKSQKAPEFNDVLRNARAQKEELKAQKEAAGKEQPVKSNRYNSKGEVSDGSQPIEDSKLENKVARRALDKKEVKAKSVNGDDFVMPGMLASKFSVPKRGLDTEIANNEMIPGVASEDSMMEQEAVSDFVEKMQEQFGITAEQILAAFSQLTPQVLAAPVSESTQAFVNELPLNVDQKSQAAAMYTEMLQQTGDQVFGEQLTGNSETAVGTQVLGQKEYNQQVLDQSLRDMNQQFFRNAKVEENNSQGKVSVAGMTAATGTLATAQAAATVAGNGTGSISSSGKAEGNLSPASKKSADASVSGPAAFFSGMTAALSEGNSSAASNDGGSNFSQQQQQQQPQQAQSIAPQMKMQMPMMAAGAFTPEIAKPSVSAAAAEGKETKGLKGDDLLNALNSSLGQGLTSTKLADAAAGAMLPGAVQPSAEQKDANIQNLISNAQVIIKKGGGEMKLEMSPEGMGQVSLKVAVENGQVNIQMITENKEAKKMIEEGLSELKASLAAHKLQVDNLKVDLSDGISKQMQEQLHDHKQNQAREFAQNFLGNMRDERQGFRQGFFDNSGYKAYKNVTEREGGVPQPTAPVASGSAAQKKQTDRRLDMVA